MNRKTTTSTMMFVYLVISLVLSPLAAATTEEKDLTPAINALARCHGVYSFYADVLDSTNQPAQALFAWEMANGAMAGALFFLRADYQNAHPNVQISREKLDGLNRYVEAYSKSAVNQMNALAEAGHPTDRLLNECLIWSEFQGEAIQIIRDKMYR